MNSKTRKVLFSSASLDWETPQEFFDSVNREFHFTLDVCADVSNRKVDRWFSIDGSGMAQDGLAQDWSRDTCWMNPPYGREIKKWIRKAYEESLRGATVVCLLPARTDTSYFHDFILGKAEIRFLRGRVKFLSNGVPLASAPFPSMIVIYRPGKVSRRMNAKDRVAWPMSSSKNN